MSGSATVRKEGGKRLAYGSRTTLPLVSVITVVYRDCSELRPLMESIFSQPADEIEIIVVDGGSSDGTVELLQEWNSKIDYWLSEKDFGIYDAMNKGIAVATGEYILHLNAGDRFRHFPRAELLQCKLDAIDVVCFDVLMDDNRVYKPRLGFVLRIDNSLHHQGTFYRRICHPGYNLCYRVFGDFDVNQKLYKDGCSIKVLSGIVAEVCRKGVSSSGLRRIEVYQIIFRNYGAVYLAIAFVRFQLNSIRRALTHGWHWVLGTIMN